jgi:hypothetical protein
MLDKRRLERAERALAALVKRLALDPSGYIAQLLAMTYDQLEAEKTKVQAERDKELRRHKGPFPSMCVKRYEPGYDLAQANLRCLAVDHVWAKRLRKDIAANRLLHGVTWDDEGRRRLDEDHYALTNMAAAVNKRFAETKKWFQARQNGSAKAK